ncbi:MAG: polysaccharide biosynthesis/export family protein [Pedobacter sp.]|nr:polysaccharide biosynthesis/export family protein [Pedobacter sp.]MDQ8053963.1 polysaccharide biosynthesis/export family protein [Pedobacter sp.]
MQKITTLNKLFFLFTIALLCAACSSKVARREKSLFNASTDIVTDTIKQVYVVNDQGLGDLYYKIKPNDLIAVRNLQNQEFGATTTTMANSQNSGAVTSSNTITYQVDADGVVNLPAVGRVAVGGLTRKEATAKLQFVYGEKLLKNPIIEVTIVNVKVTLLGEFNRQGNFLLERDNTNLIDIIGEAGGITKNADPKTLKIIRGDRSKPELIYVNLNDVNSLASKKLILQNNDIIVLQQTKSSALGEKLQSSNNILQPLLVVINLAALIFTLTR